jgi:hypothetical protein
MPEGVAGRFVVIGDAVARCAGLPGTLASDRGSGELHELAGFALVCQGILCHPVPLVRSCRSELQMGAEAFKMESMNAAEQARSLELAQAIASVAALFRERFPDARANLTPWRDDPLTRAFQESECLDLSFHFPGWSPRLECRSLLVQLRLERPATLADLRPRLLGVLIRGLTYESERWRLATVGDWLPSGSHLPRPDVSESLRQICRELFELFGGEDGATGSDRQAA